MTKARKKSDLPSKTCAYCGLPFSWRKKWARDWDGVKYCSKRCRREAKGVNAELAGAKQPNTGH